MKKNQVDEQFYIDQFLQLTPQERHDLIEWITTLTPTKYIKESHWSSYRWKNIAERYLPFYIYEHAFTGAMIVCGYKYKKDCDRSFSFNVKNLW